MAASITTPTAVTTLGLTAALVAAVGARAVPPAGRTSHLRRVGPSLDLPLDDQRLAPRDDRIVEQVHVNAGADPSSAIVTWISAGVSETSLVYSTSGGSKMTATGEPGQRYSFLLDPSSYYPVNTTCTGSHNYTDPECYYTSGEIHNVVLTNLKPATTYSFTVAGDTETFNFNTGAAVGSGSTFSFGIVGDLGQTENSSHTVDNLKAALAANSIDMILHAGDLSYADGYAPRWDSYARAFEPLFANIKTAYVGGNHEVSSGGENWVNYKARYPNQHSEVGSDSFLWYSFETGPAHVIMLCSYADFASTSAQYQWAAKDLANVDRSKTPWVIAVWHTPWYTSNAHHPMTEGSEMRADMEALLLQHEVDVVFNGHVHAYERTHPVAMEKVDCENGINYVTIGDGGNREQFAYPWTDVQPDWSAIREFAYGYGKMEIINSTHALWQWHRDIDPWNSDPTVEIGDQTYFVRHSSELAGVHNSERC